MKRDGVYSGLSDEHSSKLFTSSLKSEAFPISGFHCLPRFTLFLSMSKFHKHPEVSIQKIISKTCI